MGTAASEPLADDKGESTVPTSLDPQIASCHRQDAGPPQVWRTGTLSRPWAGQAFIRTDGGCDWFGLVVLGGVPHPLLGLRHRVERFSDCHQVKKKAAALSPELIISPFPGSSTCCG